MLGPLSVGNSGSIDFKDQAFQDAEALVNKKHGGGGGPKKKPSLFDEAPKMEQEARPASVIMAEGKLKSKDLLEQFTEKIAEKGLGSGDDAAQEIESKLDSFFSKGLFGSGSAKDVAVLSMAAQQSQTEDIKPRSTKAKTFWDDVVQEPGASTKKQGADAVVLQMRGAGSVSMIPEEIQKTARDLVKRYLVAFSGAMMTDSPKKKQEATQLREKLAALDFPVNSLQQAEKNVQRMMYQDIKQKAKEAIIKLALTYSDKKSLDVAQQGEAFLKIQALGKRAGIFSEESDVADVKKEGLEETQGVLTHELDQLTMKRGIEGNLRELIKDFGKLDSISSATSFDKEAYFTHFQKKLDHLGLKPFFSARNPSRSGTIDTDARGKPKTSEKLKDFFKQFAKEKMDARLNSTKTGGQGKGSAKQGKEDPQKGGEEEDFDMSQLGEGDSIEDQIRSLYMQLCIKLDLKSQVKLRLDLFRLKRKCGFDDTKMLAIKKEAEAIAVFKLSDLLREAFEERASLMDLKGPAYELVRAKFKVALKGLSALRAKPERKEMDKLRDQVNRSIFTVIKEDYLKVELYLESDPPNKVAVKVTRDRYLAMLNRLKGESKIMEEIRPKLFQDIALKSDTNIVDVA